MEKNKNLTLILTILFVLAFSVFGFILFNKFILMGSSSIASKTHLEYWGLFESELVMNEMIKKYESENPNISINYVQKLAENDLNGYKKTLLRRLQNGTGPAIFRAHSTWMSEYYNELSLNNKAITPEVFKNRFYDIADIQCVTLNMEIACMPIMYDGLVLLYNVDALKAEGISAESIQSWEDLRVAAIRLTKYEETGKSYSPKIVRSGVALGDSSNVVNTTDVLGLMFSQNGINIPDDLDSEKVGLVFEFYSDFVAKDAVWADYMPNSLNAFASGQTAMVFAKGNQILDILKLNPTINLGAISVPQLPLFGGTLTQKGWGSFWAEAVSADLSDNEQKEAWKFIEWLSREENQVSRFNLASKYKRFGEPYSAKSLRNNLINSPLLGPMIKLAPDASTSIISDNSGNDDYVNLMNAAVKEYSAATGSTTKKEILSKLKADYEALDLK